MVQILNLEPQRVFQFFQEICAIPHGSGNTEALSLYCLEVAHSHNLWCRRDEAGNVLIRRPADPGYGDVSPVVLQAHLDMVCVCADSQKDTTTVPVNLQQKDDFLLSKDSTLGADNGIGIAYILALLTQKNGNYPMLEGLLTVDEETTMSGARFFDISQLQGHQMINLDSEEEGVLLAGTAGGISLDCFTEPQLCIHGFRHGIITEIKLNGLEGGHSGLDIHKNCGNAIKALVELLKQIEKQMDCCLCSFAGGRFSNSIPYEACCRLVIERDALSKLHDLVRYHKDTLRQSLQRETIDLSVFESSQEVDKASGIPKELLHRWLNFIDQVPNGVQRMDNHTQETVSLSTNLGIFRLDEQSCQASFSLRSNTKHEQEALLLQISQLAKHFGFSILTHSEYPCWEYREDSPLREQANKTYMQITGHPLQVVTIHAGSECGIFGSQLPNLDCISIGPDIMGAHTVNEQVSISSVGRVWEFLQALLKNLAISNTELH